MQDEMVSTNDKAGTPAKTWIPALAAAIVLPFLLYGDTLKIALVGHDTLPIVLSSRIETVSDLPGAFTEELMNGLYTKGHFYRPVLNLFFALDYTLFGLDAFGYHLTDLLLLGICAFLLALLARNGDGKRLPAAGAVAALFFLTNPVHLNILPVAARRADILAILFILLGLHGSLRKGRSRLWLPPLFTLLACGAKETGALAPFLIFAHRLFIPRPDKGSRLKQAAAAAAPSFGALVPFLAAREAVLGGVGGHAALTLESVANHLLMILGQFQTQTYDPHLAFSPFLSPAWSRTLLFLVLAGASLLLLRRPAVRGTALFAWTWMVLGWAIHGLSQLWAPWYPVHTAAPFALVAGMIVEEALRAAAGRKGKRGAASAGGRPPLPAAAGRMSPSGKAPREPGRTSSGTGSRRNLLILPVRAAAALTGLLFLFLLAVNVAKAPPFTPRPEWREMSRNVEAFLGRLETKLAPASGGETIAAPGLPYEIPHREGSPIFEVFGLTDYTVAAWAKLRFPGKKIRVSFPRPRMRRPEADEILVVVSLGRPRNQKGK